jgi:hypothetical protein
MGIGMSKKVHCSVLLPKQIEDLQPITKVAFNQTISKVKEECETVAHSLVLEFECCFPEHHVTIAPSFYSQF